ncbi:MAG: DUF6174 domain-containing protein [Gammaproteobacteria bacterium]|nr:DUF6174 domain-containing protein [Gammaproteobacteria bacterium]MDH5802222.1 DUF6174 domain-containing protein [Gammaproteobacteria bacterium]
MEENKAKWNGQRIRNYHIAENVGCFCPITHNVIIMVSDSVLIHVEPNTNLGEDPTQIALSLYSFYKTIDELFSEIDSAITNGVDNLTVEYDSDLGYPTFIDVDPISSGVDDEYSYKISLLEIY